MQANYAINNKKKVGWSNTPIEHPTSFGVASGGRDDGIKSKLVNLISSVRTLMRSMFFFLFFVYLFRGAGGGEEGVERVPGGGEGETGLLTRVHLF